MSTHLARDPLDRKRMSVCAPPKGKAAVTHYKVRRARRTTPSADAVGLRLGAGRLSQVILATPHASAVELTLHECDTCIDPCRRRRRVRPLTHLRNFPSSAARSVSHRSAQARLARAASIGAGAPGRTRATGRTHQIRVHMKHIGHALLGDKVYLPDRPRHARPDREELSSTGCIAYTA